MASIEQLQTALDKLTADISLPGLNPEAVIKNLIEVQYKNELDQIKSYISDAEAAEKEAAAVKERLTSYYNSGQAKIEIKNQINSVKINFKAATDGVKQLPVEIQTMIAANLIPPTIPIPTAPGVPNPMSFLLKNKEKLNGFLTILNAIASWIVNLLSSAVKIAFELPDTVLALIDQLANIKSLIQSIPMP
jgi:hypothetical protein